MNFNTAVLHAGKTEAERHGSTLPPVYLSSAFEQKSAKKLAEIFENKAPGYCYTRVANPTVTAFENRITKLEGGIASVAFASGMAAISNAFLNILQSGNEIVTSASLYGGTVDLFRDFETWGIHTVFVKNNDWKAFEEAINENTRLIFAETIGNPGLDVTDIRKLAKLAHSHGLPLIIDNTTATSYLVRPLELGADIVVNSSSKYINGNSSGISGILTDGGHFKWTEETYPVLGGYLKYGPMAYTARMRASVFRNMGACLSPQNAFLNLIGLETLGLRMERQCQNAMRLASWIQETYPEIIVNFPGLKVSPWHEIARQELVNGYGAIFTMRTGSKETAFALLDHLKLALQVSNIGDTKTLAIHPASTVSLHSTQKQKEEAGVYEDLIRISVGIEDIVDLMEDFRQAIEIVMKPSGGGNGMAEKQADYAALKKGGFMRQKQKGYFSLRLQVVGGNLTAENIRTVSEVADQYGRGYVHMTSRQGIEIPFIRFEDIEEVKEKLAAGGVKPGVCGPRVRTVTACQGDAICPSGCIDTNTLAKELDRRYFGKDLPHKFKFGVTGCQNNCLKAEENDLGVKGGMTVTYKEESCIQCGVCVKACREHALTIEDGKVFLDREMCNHCGRCVKSCPTDAWEGESGYILSFGGLFGNKIYQGETLFPIVKDKETLFRITDAALGFFEKHANPGERFRLMLQRIGEEEFKKVIMEAYHGGNPI